LSAKHDLGITVLYGEEVLKSQFQVTSDEEVAEWVKTVWFPSRFYNRQVFYHIYEDQFLEY
jgi:hypothetical protein